MPSLPPSLFSSYKEYKQKQRRLVRWLLSCAEKYNVNPFIRVDTSKNSSLKGGRKKNATKGVKKGGGGNSGGGKNVKISDLPTHLTLNQLVTISDRLREVVGPNTAPQEAIKLLEDIIRWREQVSLFYSIQPSTLSTKDNAKAEETESDEDERESSNQSHQHVINILKRIKLSVLDWGKQQENEVRTRSRDTNHSYSSRPSTSTNQSVLTCQPALLDSRLPQFESIFSNRGQRDSAELTPLSSHPLGTGLNDLEPDPSKDRTNESLSDFLPNQPPARPQKPAMPARPLSDFDMKPDDDDEDAKAEERRMEAAIAVFSFFQDGQNLLNYIEQTWMEFRRGEIELVTASFITSQAVEIVKEMEEDLANQFFGDREDKELDYVGMVNALIPSKTVDQMEWHDLNPKFRDFIWYKPFVFFSIVFRESEKDKEPPFWQKNIFLYNEIVNGARVVLCTPFGEEGDDDDFPNKDDMMDFYIMKSALVTCLAQQSDPAAKDEFHFGLGLLELSIAQWRRNRDQCRPPNLLFPWYVYLTIHKVMEGAGKDVCGKTFQKSAKTWKNILDAREKWYELDIGYSTSFKKYRQTQKRSEEFMVIPRTLEDKNNILRSSPWNCGAWECYLLIRYHISSIDIIHDSRFVANFLFMYHALVEHGLIQHWRPIQRVLEIAAPIMFPETGLPKKGNLMDATALGVQRRRPVKDWPDWPPPKDWVVHDLFADILPDAGGSILAQLAFESEWDERKRITEEIVVELFPSNENERALATAQPGGFSMSTLSRKEVTPTRRDISAPGKKNNTPTNDSAKPLPHFGRKLCDPFTLLDALKSRTESELHHSLLGANLLEYEVIACRFFQRWYRKYGAASRIYDKVEESQRKTLGYIHPRPKEDEDTANIVMSLVCLVESKVENPEDDMKVGLEMLEKAAKAFEDVKTQVEAGIKKGEIKLSLWDS